MSAGQGIGFQVTMNDPTINRGATDVAAFGNLAEAEMFFFSHGLADLTGSRR
jgi:hypothetical protein